MPESEPTRKAPIVRFMKAGTYWWCACGRSKYEPFCDGSHKGSGLAPLEVQLSGDKTVAWCTCKRTGTPPFCDGSHHKPQAFPSSKEAP